ncbi:MAG: DUF3298 domain-containing protein [Lachnospiraceae bacterium]|nr:DUF3298 domain-containing protein [Lachnospiraceae bacterium]
MKSNKTAKSALLLMLIVFIISGCGKKEADTRSVPDKEEIAGVSSEETEAEEEDKKDDKSVSKAIEASEEVKEADAEETVSNEELLQPLVAHEMIYRGDNRSTLYYAKYDMLSIGEQSKKYPGLEETLAKWSDEVEKEENDQADPLEQEAKEWRDTTGEETPYYSFRKVYIKRADADVFSFISTSEEYTGGAHGMNGTGGYNYYTATGEEILLTDVIADRDMLNGVLADKLKAKYPDTAWFEDPESVLSGYGRDGLEYSFVIGNRDITFFFNPYELASYADGGQTVSIGLDEVPGLFTGRIRPMDGAYVEALDFYQDRSVYDKLGNARNLMITGENDYDAYGYPGEYMVKSIRIDYGDEYLEDEDSPVAYAYDHDIFLVHTEDGRNYLYFDCYQDNDWHSVQTYELGFGGGIRSVSETDGGFAWLHDWEDGERYYKPAVFDQNKFILLTRGDVLSTVSTIRYYRTGLKGDPEPYTNYYTIRSDLTLKSKRPLRCRYLGETEDISIDAPEVSDKNALPEELPAGTGYLLWRTDDEAYVDCVVNDNGKKKVYRLIRDYDKEGYPCIDGVRLEDCFEELLWAG